MAFADMKISTKIIGLVLGLLALGGISSGIGVMQLSKVGDELIEIAEQDIPLTEIITKVTVHQLEQAILLEKGLVIALDEAHGTLDQLTKTQKDFATLGHKVEEEILEAEEMLAHAIQHAHTAASKAEFEKLLKAMKQVEVEHVSYEKHGEEMFALLVAGDIKAALDLSVITIQEQEKLDKELIQILAEIESFTLASAQKAEQDEINGLKMMTAATIISLVFGLIVGLVLARGISSALGRLTGIMGTLAGGNTDVEVTDCDRKDEVGSMANAVLVFRDNAVEVKRLEAEQKEAEVRAAAERKAAMDQLANEFEGTVGHVINGVTGASAQIEHSAQSMAVAAEKTTAQSVNVASASDQAAANVQTVASAAEELASSISEISRQVGQSAEIARQASKDVSATNDRVESLASAAERIGEVVSLISDIADQTNLLALNATIEAARAGEAGKGFAVVASEVKNLASQTAKATDEISSQIAEIQAATHDAVHAIGGIQDVITNINDVSQGIAAAVEEQGAATQEIARNVEQAASGTSEVTTSINTVANSAQETGETAQELTAAAETLSSESTLLQTSVADFLKTVRAA